MAKKKKFSLREQFKKDMQAHSMSFKTDEEWVNSGSLITKHLKEETPEPASIEDATSVIDVGSFAEQPEPEEAIAEPAPTPEPEVAVEESLTQFDVSSEAPELPEPIQTEAIAQPEATPDTELTTDIAQPAMPENQLVTDDQIIASPISDDVKQATRTERKEGLEKPKPRSPQQAVRARVDSAKGKTQEQKQADYKQRRKDHQETRSKRLQEQFRAKYGIQSKNEKPQAPKDKPAAGVDRTSTEINFRAQANNRDNFMTTEQAGDTQTSFHEMMVRNMERTTEQLTFLMTRVRMIENSLDRARA